MLCKTLHYIKMKYVYLNLKATSESLKLINNTDTNIDYIAETYGMKFIDFITKDEDTKYPYQIHRFEVINIKKHCFGQIRYKLKNLTNYKDDFNK